MVENARFVNAKLLMRKLGVTETSIVQNIFVRFVFPRSGFRQCAHVEFLRRYLYGVYSASMSIRPVTILRVTSKLLPAG